jgi:hypothetical protein
MEKNDYIKETASPQGAFERFKAKIKKLSDRQNGVFAEIMERIDRRKTDEARQCLEKQNSK